MSHRGLITGMVSSKATRYGHLKTVPEPDLVTKSRDHKLGIGPKVDPIMLMFQALRCKPAESGRDEEEPLKSKEFVEAEA